MDRFRRVIYIGFCLFVGIILAVVSANTFFARAQYIDPTILPPPPPSNDVPAIGMPAVDSAGLPNLTPTVPPTYEALAQSELAGDLATPSNIKTEVEYDYESGCYIVRTKVGDYEIATPFMLTPEQYNDIELRRSMQAYFNRRNSELVAGVKDKQPFDVLDMNFAIGPLEKIFGPGGVQLQTQGSVQLHA